MHKLIEKAQQDSTVMWLLITTSTLTGLLLGIICSPVKNGISIGNNNTIIGDGNKCDDEEEPKRGKCCHKHQRNGKSNIMKF